MKSLLSLLAAYTVAGGFAVAAVSQMTFQSYSNSQPYVRMVR